MEFFTIRVLILLLNMYCIREINKKYHFLGFNRNAVLRRIMKKHLCTTWINVLDEWSKVRFRNERIKIRDGSCWCCFIFDPRLIQIRNLLDECLEQMKDKEDFVI